MKPADRAAANSTVPTCMIQGGSDAVGLPEATEGKDRYFTDGYARHVIAGVGHFPAREAPDAVNNIVMRFLRGGRPPWRSRCRKGSMQPIVGNSGGMHHEDRRHRWKRADRIEAGGKTPPKRA
jgi:hypothetical protein